MKKISIVFAFALMMIASLSMAAEPIKIGFLYVLSGRMAGFGMVSKKGAEFAIEEINRAGGVDGRKIQAIFEDTKLSPEVTIKAVKKLVSQDKVDVLIGIISSKVAGAVAPHIQELKTPLIITTAQTPVVTGSKCNPYIFRITWNTAQSMKAAALYAQNLTSKKWTTVGPAYALGYESWSLFKKHLKALRPDVSFSPKSDVVFGAMSTQDWTPYIRTLMSSQADGVLISLWGGNLIDFVRQAHKMNFFDGSRECLWGIGAVSMFLSLGQDMPVGLRVVAPYWHDAPYGPLNQAIVEKYSQKYSVPPSYQSQFAYTAVKVYADTVKALGATDKEAIIKGLEGAVFRTLLGDVTFRAGDHQAMFNVVAGTVSKEFSFTRTKNFYRKLSPIVMIPADKVAIPLAETGCTMK